MGYLDIKNREDINDIIGKTLSIYYQTNVIVCDRYSRNSFILNPRLNTAILNKPSKKVKKAIRIGYSVRRNVFLYLAMQLYITFGFSKFGFFGCQYITFEKLPSNSKDLYIMPGNMKLKVLNFRTMKIDNIIKNKYQKSSFKKEKSVRLVPEWDFILPMKILSNIVYQEELLLGCSLDRLKNELRDPVEKIIEGKIFEIQKKNRKSINSIDYGKSLIRTIEDMTSELQNGSEYKAKLIDFAKRILKTLVNTNIDVCFSHGDFQNGNIFITENGKVYVIDWETFDVRSLGYDLLTYFYKFRYRKDFLLRIDIFLKDEKWDNISNKFYEHIINKSLVLTLYLLEDIVWILSENLQTSEKRFSNSLIIYTDKMFQDELLKRIKDNY